MTPHAYIVVGLGYGDEGKGTMVDFLARQHDARLVVRYNGGPQAAHNVVLSDGRSHSFHNFGSASFLPQVRTHLSRFMAIDPYGMVNEAGELGAEIWERTTISPLCPVVTPFHWMLNRMRERRRGGARHGSCGYGVGELQFFITFGKPTLYAWELQNEERTRAKLKAIKEIAIGVTEDLQTAREVANESVEEAASFYREFAQLATLNDDEAVRAQVGKGVTIFEGAQGVLLDERYGVEPHRTWTNTTPGNALRLIGDAVPSTVVGVTRTFLTRHGPGPFPTETPAAELRPPESERNQWSEFQRDFRVGWFDLLLFRYALKCAGRVDTIALTHCDWRPEEFKWAGVYSLKDGLFATEVTQEWTAEQFAEAKPLYAERRGKPVHELFAEVTGRKVGYVSSGPTERDKVQL